MKAALRHGFRQLRRQHVAGLQQVLEHSLGGWLQPCTRSAAGRHLGLFWPQGSEPDLRSSLQQLSSPLALPVVEAGELRYRNWRPGERLAPDECGIPAPLPSMQLLRAEQLALLLVPALAIDRGGVRLGSGGGWYDRLRSEPAWRAVPALVVLPAACVSERLPADPWDVPFDGWLDELGLHWLTPPRF